MIDHVIAKKLREISFRHENDHLKKTSYRFSVSIRWVLTALRQMTAEMSYKYAREFTGPQSDRYRQVTV